MKTTNSGVSMPIDKNDMKELLKETKETVAKAVVNKDGQSIFGVVDLWRMQKKHKTLGSSTKW